MKQNVKRVFFEDTGFRKGINEGWPAFEMEDGSIKRMYVIRFHDGGYRDYYMTDDEYKERQLLHDNKKAQEKQKVKWYQFWK